MKNKDPNAPATVTTTLNNSVTYDSTPFRFKDDRVKFGKRSYNVPSLESLLRESKFMRARGVDLAINVITPVPEFTDKAKTHINADGFKDGLATAVHAVCKDAIKKVERAERENRAQERRCSISSYREPRITKERIMYILFDEAYKRAIGS